MLFDEKENPIKEFYYKCLRGINKVKSIPREVKWFYQRGKRGYADCDLWSFDDYLSHIIPIALKDMAKNHTHGCADEFFGCPPESEVDVDEHHRNCDLCKETYGECIACNDWRDILINIAEGFEAYHRSANDDYEEVSLWYKETKHWFEPCKDSDCSTMKSETTPDGEKYWKTIGERREADFKKWEKTAPLFIKYFGNMWD